MRRFFAIIALILAVAGSSAAHADESDITMVSTSSISGAPATYVECVLLGGQARSVGEDLTCRFVGTSDIRIYYTVTSECDEELQAEYWGEVRGGVITYAFEPHRTEVLPELGWPDDVGSSTPIACQGD